MIFFPVRRLIDLDVRAPAALSLFNLQDTLRLVVRVETKKREVLYGWTELYADGEAHLKRILPVLRVCQWGETIPLSNCVNKLTRCVFKRMIAKGSRFGKVCRFCNYNAKIFFCDI